MLHEIGQIERAIFSLNIVAAIVLWNNVYLQKAIERLKERNAPIPEQYLPYLSPMLRDHILLMGEYRWLLPG